MSKTQEALKMAIEALLYGTDHTKAVLTCKEALAECEQAEPAAWVEYKYEQDAEGLLYPVTYLHEYDNGNSQPLYTAPQDQSAEIELLKAREAEILKALERKRLMVLQTAYGYEVEQLGKIEAHNQSTER